jgi:hypothetical protein
MRLTKKQSKELDKLLEELYKSNVHMPFFGEGFSLNERCKAADVLVDDGYAELSHRRDGELIYAITQQGRSFCRRGGYLQTFREATRATIQKWIDRICGFISGAVLAWILNHIVYC